MSSASYRRNSLSGYVQDLMIALTALFITNEAKALSRFFCKTIQELFLITCPVYQIVEANMKLCRMIPQRVILCQLNPNGNAISCVLK